MPILSTIMSLIIGPLLDKLIGPLTDCYKAYINKQITEAQLREQIQALMVNAYSQIEVEHSETLGKTYASFMQAATQSKLLQAVWAFVTISQATMLLWFQIGIPAIVAVGLVDRWPSSGDTAQWAYALVGACVGMGPLVLRTGPGTGSIAVMLKSLIGK